ncbi:MAG: hypothetical protein P1V20_30970 [Verrucomicrobiales bacterium]|nr:hypothetical protein [Verrucomicrobiales bacterium]
MARAVARAPFSPNAPADWSKYPDVPAPGTCNTSSLFSGSVMRAIKADWRFNVRRINPKVDQEYGNFDLPPGASMSKLTLMKQLSYFPVSFSKVYPSMRRYFSS